MKIDNRAEDFKYLGSTLTNHNPIQAEIKSRLNSGDAFYHEVQNHLSSSYLSKNSKIKVYRTIILPAVIVWVWNLVVHIEECRLRVFENRVWR
jgi:hypothetical protein